MEEFRRFDCKVFELSKYRKRPSVVAEDATAVLLRNATGFTFESVGGFYKAQPPEVYQISVTATVTLHHLPSTGSRLLDLLYSVFGRPSRYVLSIAVTTDTLGGKRHYNNLSYDLYTPIEVMRQINRERTRVLPGRGEFYFENLTGEPDALFRKIEWLAAQ